MKNILEYEKLDYVPIKLYHYTLSENIQSIESDGVLRADSLGYVYLTETIEDSQAFVTTYAMIKGIDLKKFSIIEIDTSGEEIYLIDNLYISTDHNPKFFSNAKAIAHNGDLKVINFTEYNFY